VIGASGLVGSALCARLSSEGYEVTAAVHRPRTFVAGNADLIGIELARMQSADKWIPLLLGVDAVINCAGLLQDAFGERVADVHQRAPAALFAACALAKVRRVIHLSAIGVDRAQPTAFSESKAAAEAALSASDLDWVILRPSVIVGRQAYGGSALFRGLAVLPVSAAIQDAGRLQVVQLDDVVETILFFLRSGAPARIALDIAGPQELRFEEVVALYRSWLGLPPARAWKVPSFAMKSAFAAGDFLGFLGWRPPVRTNAAREMVRGATGDASRWTQMTGIRPQGLSEALAREPASVQERWFARMYFLKPLIFAVLAAFWIGTAFMALGPGWSIGLSLMHEGGVAEPYASGVVVAGALADLLIGLGIAFRRTARPALMAGIFVSVAYAVTGSWLVPRLWIDPLGPMLKIWPILVLNAAALAILEDR
jgi:uncharacterized protein YbjT (DUF2867 family)